MSEKVNIWNIILQCLLWGSLFFVDLIVKGKKIYSQPNIIHHYKILVLCHSDDIQGIQSCSTMDIKKMNLRRNEGQEVKFGKINKDIISDEKVDRQSWTNASLGQLQDLSLCSVYWPQPGSNLVHSSIQKNYVSLNNTLSRWKQTDTEDLYIMLRAGILQRKIYVGYFLWTETWNDPVGDN